MIRLGTHGLGPQDTHVYSPVCWGRQKRRCTGYVPRLYELGLWIDTRPEKRCSNDPHASELLLVKRTMCNH